MRRATRITVVLLFAPVVIVMTAWAVLAFWYRLPFPEVARFGSSALFAAFGWFVVITLFTRKWGRALIVFAAAFAVVLAWWQNIEPAAKAEWATDVSRQVTGTIEGNTLTLANVRDFEWRANDDFTERWQTRTYDLATLRSLDLFMSYWAGPEMAHVILSFGFEDGRYLAWSVEVRRRKGGAFSPIADFFKSNPLTIVAAEERDVVGVRANVRGEDVQLYRLNVGPDAARELLLEYVADANALAQRPRFYNSITTNCATTVVKMIRAVGDEIPFDWRLIVNGYLPEYAYDQGALDSRHSIEELRRKAHIDQRAKAAGLTAEFSRAIREGVPSSRDGG